MLRMVTVGREVVREIRFRSGRPGGRPRWVVQVARTDVLSRRADPHVPLKIAALLPRRPHLPMSGCPNSAASYYKHQLLKRANHILHVDISALVMLIIDTL
jgi:hypothetical protein